MTRAFTRDPPSEPPTDDLYDKDFHAWTVTQAHLLRAGDFDRVDLANIVE